MKKNNYFSFQLIDDKLTFLDQTKLPFEKSYIETDDCERIAKAIENINAIIKVKHFFILIILHRFWEF